MKRVTDCCNSHPYVDDYLAEIDAHPELFSDEMILMRDMVRADLKLPGVYIDHDAVAEMVRMIEQYMGMTLMPWELFICALIHAFQGEMLLYNKFLILVGRGNGKNGFISALAWYFVTPNHGVKGYNVDIVANSEDQATTSFYDIYEVLEEDATGKLKPQFKYTKEIITNKLTKSSIKYNTSNARTKDGKRSACLIFDEVHEYENFKLINTFSSGFGKRPRSRTFYITTNGYVREGVLDQLVGLAMKVLRRKTKNRIRMLPVLYKVNKRADVYDPEKWIMANPSLPYFQDLRAEMEDQFESMEEIPETEIEFFTKRMNLPAQDALTAIATEEQILATNRPIPYELLRGRACIGAVDYSMTNDFCSVGLLFKMDGIYYLVEHTFICHVALERQSRKIEAPVQVWAEQGLVTILPEETLRPEYVVEWFQRMSATYSVMDIKADDYKFTFLEAAFEKAALPLTKVRTGEKTHTQLSPIINAMFAERLLVCGDNPVFRWYVRNVYKKIMPNGNIKYEKIEQIKRKTDGFYMFTHALNGDSELTDSEPTDMESMRPVHF